MPGIDFTKRYRDYARFTPAISEMYTRFVTNTDPKRPCPVPQQDLDFLDPNSNLFHISSSLYSAGQAAKSEKLATTADCMVTGRDKGNTIILGDSGGFQIQTGAIKFKGDETRNRMMRWMEANCDWSMILDFPTGGINMGTIEAHTARLRLPAGSVDEKGKLIPDTGYGDELDRLCRENKEDELYNTCLLQTLINNDWFVKNREPGATKFLNVVQGRTPAESKIWYDKVKHYPFEGWSLAGPHKENFEMTMCRIIEMRDEGLLQDKDWMHFLGVGKLLHGCAYTTIQREIRKDINPNFTISYDVSSPFTLAAYGKLFLGYTLDRRGWGITGEKFDGREYLPGGSKAHLPFLDEVRALWETKLNEQAGEMVMDGEMWGESTIQATQNIKNHSRFIETEIGKKLRMDQVCVNDDPKFTSTWDVVTYAMMMNHNVQVHMEAVFEGQDLYDNDDVNRVPASLLDLKYAIQDVFKSEMPMEEIRKHRKALNSIAGAAAENGVAVLEAFEFAHPKVYKTQMEAKKDAQHNGLRLTTQRKKDMKKAGIPLPTAPQIIRDPGLFGE